MTTEINTKILINRKPEKVWSILVNFENYSNWTPL